MSNETMDVLVAPLVGWQRFGAMRRWAAKTTTYEPLSEEQGVSMPHLDEVQQEILPVPAVRLRDAGITR